MSRFGIQQISINGALYQGWTGYLLDRGVEVESDGSDGTVYETAHHVISRKPMADLKTRALKAALGLLAGSLDLPLVVLNGTTGLVMYGAKAASDGPAFAGGSVHVSRTGLRGVVYMAGVRWARKQKAEMTLKALFRSADGTTASIAEGTAALPAAPTPDQGFALTALTLNGVAVGAVNSVDLSADPKLEHDYSTGLPEPVDINGAGARGKLAVALKADIGDLDLGAGTGAVSLVFTRYAIGGGFTTDTVTFTLNGQWSVEESIGGDNGSPMSRSLLVRTRHDGTNRPLAWAVA